MFSKILLWFNFGLITREEADTLVIRKMIKDNLTDYRKYTEITQ